MRECLMLVSCAGRIIDHQVNDPQTDSKVIVSTDETKGVLIYA